MVKRLLFHITVILAVFSSSHAVDVNCGGKLCHAYEVMVMSLYSLLPRHQAAPGIPARGSRALIQELSSLV